MNPEHVIAWREALVRLTDQHFFDLMRMYLGAIKTPFNKQRLIEELSAFLRKKETKDRIVSLLDSFDLMILSAVKELPSPTQQKIVNLFTGSRSFPEIYEHILNLEERLLIYRKSDAENREYAINPLLSKELDPLLGMHHLVAPVPGVDLSVEIPSVVEDLTLAAVYSFFLHEGEVLRNDGSFRKKAKESLDIMLPHYSGLNDVMDLLVQSLQNLGLLVRSEAMLIPSTSKWKQFSTLPTLERLAWLAAATGGKLQRNTLHQRAQVFLDFIGSLEPGVWYKRIAVDRLCFLLNEKAGTGAAERKNTRFAALIREQEAAEEKKIVSEKTDFIASGLAFGVLIQEDGMITINTSCLENKKPEDSSAEIVVSPSFSVTIMPGFSLPDLLPLAASMNVRVVQIAGEFEITRKSCLSAFEQGETATTLKALFSRWSTRPIPQNIVFSIEDWYRTYTSISLYHGFVLRVDENRRALFENNEKLSALIRKTLAPGVYLLDVHDSKEIQDVFTEAGLDTAPTVSTPVSQRETLALPELDFQRIELNAEKKSVGTVQSYLELQENLLAALTDLSMEPEFFEALKSRIERRIILIPSQLDPESVRIEKVEARGMDFLGKVRIAEYALASGALLEIELDTQSEGRTIVGRPISTEKQTGDVLLTVLTEPDLVSEVVSLGKALLVRRIRGSIFSELPQGRS